MPIHDWTKVDAGKFHFLHVRWIVKLCEALNDGRLPSEYYAAGEQRSSGLRLEPDVLALHDERKQKDPRTRSGEVTPGLLTVPPKASVIAESDLEAYRRKQNYVAVRNVDGDRIVAVLEIVSFGNKSGRTAVRAFADKAEMLMDREVHFMFIDLYPNGPVTPMGLHGLIWEEMTGQDFVPPPDKPLCAASYEASGLLRAFVEPLGIGDTIPDMPLFIERDAYVSVPFETTYQAAFDGLPARYRDAVLESQ